jgi:hypothetical protein
MTPGVNNVNSIVKGINKQVETQDNLLIPKSWFRQKAPNFGAFSVLLHNFQLFKILAEFKLPYFVFVQGEVCYFLTISHDL